MATKQASLKANGGGVAARRAAERWKAPQLAPQRAADGPVRLLLTIMAIGVPLACYGFAEANIGGWWPLGIGLAAPVLVIALKLAVDRKTRRRQRAQHPHPLRDFAK